MYVHVCVHGYGTIDIDIHVYLCIYMYVHVHYIYLCTCTCNSICASLIYCSYSREGPADTGRLPPGRLCATELSESCSSRASTLWQDTNQETCLQNITRLDILLQHWSQRGSNPRHSILLLPNNQHQHPRVGASLARDVSSTFSSQTSLWPTPRQCS